MKLGKKFNSPPFRKILAKKCSEKELFTENILKEGEQEYLANLLEKCELNKIAENIFRKDQAFSISLRIVSTTRSFYSTPLCLDNSIN